MLLLEPHILSMLQKNRESVTIESGMKSEFKIKKRIRSAGSSGQLMGWKKMTYILRAAMMVLTTILIVLFLVIMSMVGKIQGTARVVNYAGLVRGGTQRMVKLEISGAPQDKMYETIYSYIEGLRNGSEKLNFVRLDDEDFQTKMDELEKYFDELRSEILLVREKGYENTEIIEKSEKFFQICD